MREYAISTLVVALALYFALGVLQSMASDRGAAGRKQWIGFSAVALLSPTLSYGSLFAIGSLFGVLLFTIVLRRPQPKGYLVSWALSFGSFIVWAVVIFWAYARRQFGITSWTHLEAFYPNMDSGVMSWLNWATKSTLTYLLFLVDDKSVVAIFLVAAVAIALAAFLLGKNRAGWNLENGAFILIVATSVLLVVGSILAATLQVYPFGPNRQQLFAAPLIVVTGSFLTYVLAIRIRQYWWLGVIISLFLVAYFQNDMLYHVR